MRDWKFSIDEYAVLNEKVRKGLPNDIGKLVQIYELKTNGIHDYSVAIHNGDFVFVKEEELNKIPYGALEIYLDFLQGKFNVHHKHMDIAVVMIEIDYLHEQVEILHSDGSMEVVNIGALKRIDSEVGIMVENNIGKFEKIATELGQFTDKKNKQYGSSVDATYEMIKVLMDRYKNEDDTYTIPQSLLQHILLQVRMMDKINRIFNNPSGKGDSESPYRDLTGYSLIGVEMVEGK